MKHKIKTIEVVDLGAYQMMQTTGKHTLKKGREPEVSKRIIESTCWKVLKLKRPKRYVMKVTTECRNEFYYYNK